MKTIRLYFYYDQERHATFYRPASMDTSTLESLGYRIHNREDTLPELMQTLQENGYQVSISRVADADPNLFCENATQTLAHRAATSTLARFRLPTQTAHTVIARKWGKYTATWGPVTNTVELPQGWTETDVIEMLRDKNFPFAFEPDRVQIRDFGGGKYEVYVDDEGITLQYNPLASAIPENELVYAIMNGNLLRGTFLRYELGLASVRVNVFNQVGQDETITCHAETVFLYLDDATRYLSALTIVNA